MTHASNDPRDIQAALERSQALAGDALLLDEFPHLTQDGPDAALARLQHQVYDLAAAVTALARQLADEPQRRRDEEFLHGRF